jgi:hypothetical protein
VEIFIVTLIGMLIYKAIISSAPSAFTGIVISLATLLVLDITALYIFKVSSLNFDIYHFIAAYCAVALAIFLAFKA